MSAERFYFDGDHHRKLVLTQYATPVDAIINREDVQQEDGVGPSLVGQAQLPVLSEGHDRGLYQAIGRSVFGCLVAHKGDGDGVNAAA